MSVPVVQATPCGSIPIGDAEDVSNLWTYSVDLRSETGEPGLADESGWLQPGTVTRPVLPTLPGHVPIGEVRIMHEGQEVRLVGARTSRDLVEVTAEELRAMRKDPSYAAQMRAWLAE